MSNIPTTPQLPSSLQALAERIFAAFRLVFGSTFALLVFAVIGFIVLIVVSIINGA